MSSQIILTSAAPQTVAPVQKQQYLYFSPTKAYQQSQSRLAGVAKAIIAVAMNILGFGSGILPLIWIGQTVGRIVKALSQKSLQAAADVPVSNALPGTLEKAPEEVCAPLPSAEQALPELDSVDTAFLPKAASTQLSKRQIAAGTVAALVAIGGVAYLVLNSKFTSFPDLPKLSYLPYYAG